MIHYTMDCLHLDIQLYKIWKSQFFVGNKGYFVLSIFTDKLSDWHTS